VPPGSARTATGISVSIVRDPALVRTVRLVAAAVARRITGDENFVEEIRLAVGEACAVLVGADEMAAAEELRAATPAGMVQVVVSWDERLRVVVRSDDVVVPEDPAGSDVDGIEPWALLRGLVEDFAVELGPSGTALTMTWPLR
jgi:Histidine kinase-like ATPase domain